MKAMTARELAAALRRRRRRVGLTINELRARRVWATHWARLGAGRLPPTIASLEHICNVLGCDLRFVLVPKNPEEEGGSEN